MGDSVDDDEPSEPVPPIEPAESVDDDPAERERERDRARSIRPRDIRALTFGRRTPQHVFDERFPPEEDPSDVRVRRPLSREECIDGPRPCPWVSCEHHLYLDYMRLTDGIKLNYPDLDPWEMTESCALDVADRGGSTLEEVGHVMNLTRERVRQLEHKALQKLAAKSSAVRDLRDFVEPKRRLPVVLNDGESAQNTHEKPTK